MTYLIPQYPVHLVRNDSAVAVAFLAVIPQGSASSFAFALLPVIPSEARNPHLARSAPFLPLPNT